MTHNPNIVLGHGAWTDGSSWSKVILMLSKAACKVAATQLPLTSLSDDVTVTRHLTEAQKGSTLLVGHPYGGAVITEMAHHCPDVVGLVYIAAFAPDQGESLHLLSSLGEAPPGAAAIRPDPYGILWLDKEKFAENFCQDLDKQDALVMAAIQHPIAGKCFEDKITDAGWRHLPSWYQVSELDRMILPSAEQFMAQRMQAKATISLHASHVSLISYYKEVADFILMACQEV